jgi:hypothetical protein
MKKPGADKVLESQGLASLRLSRMVWIPVSVTIGRLRQVAHFLLARLAATGERSAFW